MTNTPERKLARAAAAALIAIGLVAIAAPAHASKVGALKEAIEAVKERIRSLSGDDTRPENAAEQADAASDMAREAAKQAADVCKDAKSRKATAKTPTSRPCKPAKVTKKPEP